MSVVADCGARITRMGLGDDDEPRSTYPSCVSKNASNDARFGDSVKDSDPEVHWPFASGGYTGDPKFDLWMDDWFTYAIMNELREDPSENNLLIIENVPGWTDEGRAKISQSVQSAQFLGLQFIPASILTLRTLGLTSGLVVDFGASGVRVNAVVDGKVVEHHFGASSIFSLDNGSSKDKFRESWYKDKANAGAICNALLGPGGAVDMAHKALQAVPGAASHVVLTGGFSQVEGLESRFTSELGAKHGGAKVQRAANPLLSAWLGAIDLVQNDPDSIPWDNDHSTYFA